VILRVGSPALPTDAGHHRIARSNDRRDHQRDWYLGGWYTRASAFGLSIRQRSACMGLRRCDNENASDCDRRLHRDVVGD
jgi:hypothetical protein